jgi:carbamoylphosphate synthase large subunit
MLSRYADDSYVHPKPSENYEGFINHLIDHLWETDYFAVIPVEDHTTLILAQNQDEIERTGTQVATEDPETFDLVFDKGKFFDSIVEIDVPCPTTYNPESLEEVDNILERIDYPVVIKPPSKSWLTENGYNTTLVTDENYVESPAELWRIYSRFADSNDYLNGNLPLIQEYISGHTTTTVALAEEGEILAYFQEERLRTFPASGGNSALLGAVYEPKMLKYAKRVLSHLEWTGPAMVEFMQTPDDEFYVIEVNGRYWGSLPFAIASGVDFPWLHYLQLRGIDPSPLIEFGDYRLDIVQRRLLYEDLKWCAEKLRQGNIAALGPFLTAFLRTRHTFIDTNDPLPTVQALAQATQLGINSLMGPATFGTE